MDFKNIYLDVVLYVRTSMQVQCLRTPTGWYHAELCYIIPAFELPNMKESVKWKLHAQNHVEGDFLKTYK